MEVLHVILLGAVKYFWHDTVNRTNNKTDRPILIARLSSFNTWGLGIPPLNGNTLVNYAGSLTGCDFRAIAQAAPFILEGLISNHQLEVWKALSTLVTLIWQPKIHDIDQYLVSFCPFLMIKRLTNSNSKSLSKPLTIFLTVPAVSHPDGSISQNSMSCFICLLIFADLDMPCSLQLKASNPSMLLYALGVYIAIDKHLQRI